MIGLGAMMAARGGGGLDIGCVGCFGQSDANANAGSVAEGEVSRGAWGW